MNWHFPSLTRRRILRWLLLWAVQIVMFVLAGLGAFLLRFDFSIPGKYRSSLPLTLALWVTVKTLTFFSLKLDRGIWRYFALTDLFRVILGNLVGSAAGWIVIAGVGPAGFPRSVFILDLLLCLLATGGLRIGTHILSNVHSGAYLHAPEERRALIYGAGDAGATLLHEILRNPRLAYHVCGFLDDSSYKKGLRVAGVPVMGGGEDAERLVRKHRIDLILIAIPTATGVEMTRILERCHAAGVECKTVPGLGDLIEGNSLAGQIREVAVEDLLGRTPVHLEEQPIRNAIEDRVVLVTGAAGSIGSELCRQIAAFRPAAIVGYEIAESPLFEIDREMRQTFPHVPFYPEIGSVLNRRRLDDVLRQYRPRAVYHTAAYKHVPLMEAHIFEAVENNVFGTYNVAAASQDNGVEEFLLISSDKAVRPANVMGATKRLAERIVLALQNGRTRYVAVRFGNVLGSNGSVVPIFKKQIAAGGPVTVTHPEMRRFFMTIPEACQLVLQALAVGQGGQICVLDMGQPVKIVDLARNLILLSGLRPGEDIPIEFTGTRPGEKLYEELNSLLEDTVPSGHDKIRIFMGRCEAEENLETWLDRLREICDARDVGSLVLTLKELVGDYNPSTELLRRIVGRPVLVAADSVSCQPQHL